MARPQKQNDGFKAAKITKHRNQTNAIGYAMRHIVNGDPEEEIKANIIELYGYAANTANILYCKGQRAAQMWEVHDVEKIRTRNLARLDEITEKAMEEGDISNAIKAIDVQNKTAAVYVEKQINVIGDNIRFEFSGE